MVAVPDPRHSAFIGHRLFNVSFMISILLKTFCEVLFIGQSELVSPFIHSYIWNFNFEYYQKSLCEVLFISCKPVWAGFLRSIKTFVVGKEPMENKTTNIKRGKQPIAFWNC